MPPKGPTALESPTIKDHSCGKRLIGLEGFHGMTQTSFILSKIISESSVLIKSWPIVSYLYCLTGAFYWKKSYHKSFSKAKILCLFFVKSRFSLILVLWEPLVNKQLVRIVLPPKVFPNQSLAGDGRICVAGFPQKEGAIEVIHSVNTSETVDSCQDTDKK